MIDNAQYTIVRYDTEAINMLLSAKASINRFNEIRNNYIAELNEIRNKYERQLLECLADIQHTMDLKY